MKKSILMLFVAALALGAIAGSVSSEMAIAAANAWVAKNGQFNAGTRATGVLSVRDPDNGVLLWHQVSMQGGGMLVMAPVTEIEPVVMALDNDPGELSAAHPLRGILVGDMRRRLQFLGLYHRAAPSGGASFQSVAPAAPESEISEEARAWGEACHAKWARLTGASLQEAANVGLKDIAVNVCTVKGFEKGGALTHWNQGSYNGAYLYNYHTPHHAVCGCVATACSALAQFYGTTNALAYSGKCSYNGGALTTNTIPGAIDWSILPENWGGTNAAIKASDKLTNEQQDLIGRVAFNAGVGVGMSWADDESGAFEASIVTALKDVFGFKNARAVDISPAESPDEEQLAKLMYNQLRAGVPVGFSIKGHSVVAVGYGLDSDGIERVRVFMGWGGAGDGWYALPKIDTKATMNGGTYLSEIVDCVVTMISYDDDDIVPVVGHVAMPGTQLELPGLARQIESNDYGYFGTRVPADLPASDCMVTCQGKEAAFEIGEGAQESTDAAELTEALPDALEIMLLNCTTATTLRQAKLKALREGKAILRVSGASSESNTVAVMDYIFDLDQNNTGDFTNRFVYYYSAKTSAAGDGGDLSYGVYLPQKLEVADRWVMRNGALSYGYALTHLSSYTAPVTNVESRIDMENLPVTESTNTVVSTFAPLGAPAVAVTNDVAEVDAIQTAITESLQQVIDAGWRRFEESTSSIQIFVTATPESAVENLPEGAIPDAMGLYANRFAHDEEVTFSCGAEVTNETAGIVFGCAGWSLTNATTGATQKGTGDTATFTVASNDVITLTWDLSKTKAVHVTVIANQADTRGVDPAEIVTPGTGWYAYGEPVTFTALERAGGTSFAGWNQPALNGSEGCVLQPNQLCLIPTCRCQVQAEYRVGRPTLPEVTTNTVSFKAVSLFYSVPDDKFIAKDEGPDTKLMTAGGVVIAGNDTAVDVVAANIVATLENQSYTDAAGVKWKYFGFLAGDNVTGEEEDVYAGATVTYEPIKADEQINWFWIPDLSAPDTTFTIDWDDAMSTLNAHGYSTNLISKADAERYGINIDNVKVTVPKGYTAKLATNAAGDIVASLEIDEQAFEPYPTLTIIPNGDGSVTVKADIANGVKGFWYSLYATDELGGEWSLVATGEYELGDPSVRAMEDEAVTVSIDVQPSAAKRFYKVVVTDISPTSL